MDNGDDASSFLGLGFYSHSSQHPQPGTHQPAPTSATTVENAADAAQAMMQQCLAYHQEQGSMRQQEDATRMATFPQFVRAEEQEVFRNNRNPPSAAHPHPHYGTSLTEHHHQQHEQQQHQQIIPPPPQSYYYQPTTTIQSIVEVASRPTPQQQYYQPLTAAGNDTPTAPAPNEVTTDDTRSSSHEQQTDRLIAEAQARAQAVLLRFQQQQQQQPGGGTTATVSSSAVIENRAAAAAAPEETPLDNTVSPEHYAQQRRIGLQREEERKHRALLKNLEYVVVREGQRIGTLQAAHEQVAAWERQVAQQQQLATQQRQQQLQVSSGAPPPQQQRVDDGIHKSKRRTRPGAAAHEQPQPPSTTATVAVYLSGLPTNASAVDEAFVRQLFGAYGEIVRVHFYRDAQQKLKGDGLVVYRLRRRPRNNDSSISEDEEDDEGVADDERSSLLESVCGQVSESGSIGIGGIRQLLPQAKIHLCR